MKKYLRIEVAIFISVWLFLMIAGPAKLFRDPGTFFHVKIGENILQTGQLPQNDFFSFTCYGKPWVAHQWFAECIMALINRILGFDGLLLMTATLLAFLYGWVANKLARSGLHSMLTILLVAFALLASASTLHVRPHILSIFFMFIIFSKLCDFDAGRLKLCGLFSLVPVFIIWTNIHGGVLGGLGTLGLMVGGWTLAKVMKKESPIRNSRELFLLWTFLFVCILTSLINPYGLDLSKTWLSVMTSHVVSENIQEHLPAYKAPYGWTILGLGIFYIISFLGTLPKWPRVSWLIPLIWFALGLSRVRHAPLFAIVSLIAFANLFPHVTWASWLAKKGSKIFSLNPISEKVRFSFMHGLIPYIIIISALLLNLATTKFPILGKDWVKLDKNYWPIELLPDIEVMVEDKGLGTPIFNDMLFGGFLIYYVPHLRVFIDDRCELYGNRALIDYVKADCDQFDKWARKYDFKIALVEKAHTFDKCLEKDKKWAIVNKTNSASFYKKVD